jgi:phosphomevalonate kinase
MKRLQEDDDKMKHEHAAIVAKLNAKNDMIESLQVLLSTQSRSLARSLTLCVQHLVAQEEKYHLEEELRKSKELQSTLAEKMSRAEGLTNTFELNYKSLQQEVEELTKNIEMEKDTGTFTLSAQRCSH